MSSNPFLEQMVRMHIPEGMGTQISISGFMLEADKQGCVTVPLHLVEDLKSHGLTIFSEPVRTKD